MRELKLKYFIDLVSNIGAKSQADAKAMQQAQEMMNAAIVGTNNKFLDYNKLALLAGKNTALMQEVITGATSKFTALERAMDRAGSNTSMERQLGYMQRLGGALDAAKTKAAGLRQALAQGMANAPEYAATAAAGYYGGKAVLAPPVRAFSNLESATQDLRIAMTDASGKVNKDFDKISDEATKLGNQLPGTTKDFMRAARALSTQGVPNSVVGNGGLRASAYTGVLLDLNQEQGAEVIAKLREAHGLKDNELVPMADLVQRAFFGFGIKPQEYLETAKYAAATYNTMGITGLDQARETLAIQGMAANVGLEGSSFGTNYSQMLTRLAQMEPRLAKKSQTAKDAKAMLDEHGISMSFYDDEGKFKGNLNMLQQLAKLRALNPLQQTRALNTLFGVEAGRPAQILVQKGLEGYTAAQATIANQADLDTRIGLKMETFAAKLEALGGTIENVMAKMATQLGNGAKPVIDKANDIGGSVGEFFDRHQTAGTVGLLGAGAASTYLSSRIGSAVMSRIAARGAASAGGVAAAGAAGGTALLSRAVLGRLGLYGLLAAQVWDTGDALNQLHQAKNHDGVKLSAYAQARLSGQVLSGPDVRALGTGTSFDTSVPSNDFLTVTAPGAAPQPLAAGRGAEVKVGEGRLDVNVRITDDRVTATTSVAQPLSLVRINNGATNPAGYMGVGR